MPRPDDREAGARDTDVQRRTPARICDEGCRHVVSLDSGVTMP